VLSSCEELQSESVDGTSGSERGFPAPYLEADFFSSFSALGWNGIMLGEMGGDQLTIRDYLRHSNLHVTNRYLQATSKTKRLAQHKLVDAILPTGILPKTNLNTMNAVRECFRMGRFSSGAYRPLTSPDLLEVRVASA
jgi:hypothetical protein